MSRPTTSGLPAVIDHDVGKEVPTQGGHGPCKLHLCISSRSTRDSLSLAILQQLLAKRLA